MEQSPARGSTVLPLVTKGRRNGTQWRLCAAPCNHSALHYQYTVHGVAVFTATRDTDESCDGLVALVTQRLPTPTRESRPFLVDTSSAAQRFSSSSLDNTSGGDSGRGGASDRAVGGCRTYRSPPTRPLGSANWTSIQIWCGCRPPFDAATPPSWRTLKWMRCWCSDEAASQSAYQIRRWK